MRNLWEPDIEILQERIMGQRWPFLVVQLFEKNMIGERRWVGTRTFTIDDNGDDNTNTGGANGDRDEGPA